MPTARTELAAATGTDGTIYAIGGYTGVSTISNEVDAYNSSTTTWTMSPARFTVTFSGPVTGVDAGDFSLATGGVAYASFTGTSSATGSAHTGTMQTVTVSALVGGDAPSSKLYPGGPGGDVILRVNNPNSYSVKLYSLSGNGTIMPDASHSGCTTTGVTFNPPSNPNITLAAGSSLVHVSAAASMSTASLNACQGATFTIPVTVVVHNE